MNDETLKFLLQKTNEFAKNLKKEIFFGNKKIINNEDDLYKNKFSNLKKIQKNLI